jgi:ribose/xylose/arabinose/galactoside ABC-type transport system permease subunit
MNAQSRWTDRRAWETLGPLLFLIGLAVLLSYLEPRFLAATNLLNVLRLASALSLATYGESIVLICGGIDLSLGSLAGLVSVIVALAAERAGVLPAFTLGLVLGVLLGASNGVLVTRFRLPSFVATFGMLTYAEGLANYLTGGTPVEFMPAGFDLLGGGYLGPIPIPVVVTAFTLVCMTLVLNRTKLGRCIYAVGGNERAARLSGIHVDRVRAAAFALSGLLGALASIVLTSRINSGQPNLEPALPFQAIAAAAIGGVSMRGGEGNLAQATVGVLVVTVINNGLNLLNVSTYVQMMATGLVILLAVVLDALRRHGKASWVARTASMKSAFVKSVLR